MHSLSHTHTHTKTQTLTETHLLIQMRTSPHLLTDTHTHTTQNPTVTPSALHLPATQNPLLPTVSGQGPLSHLVQPAPQQRKRN